MATPKRSGDRKKGRANSKTGFIRYKNDENGLHYFRYVNAKGETVFTSSNGYASSKSRNKGIENTRNSLSNYELRQEAGQHFFVIKAKGNNAEMARSRFFPSKSDTKKEIALIRAEFPIEKKEKKTEIRDKSTAIISAGDKNLPPRYTFRLTFYPADEGSEMTGNIEYILEDKKANFKGLDMDRIQSFLKEYLPDQKNRTTPAGKETDAVQVQKDSPKPEKKPKLPKTAPAQTLLEDRDLLEITFFEKGSPVGSNFISPDETIEIQLSADTRNMDSKKRHFEALVYAKSFKTGKKIMIGKKEGDHSGKEKIRFPVSVRSLQPGPYRMSSSLRWDSEADGKLPVMSGNALVLVR